MLTKRIIACLDVRDGRVVKGVGFRNHLDVGDIEDLARRYVDQGADELVFYDITASSDERRLDRSWIVRLASFVNIPFCVAGGISSVADAKAILRAGADKISVNSPALKRPALINELCAELGSQCVVVGIDSRAVDGEWYAWANTGREATMVDTRRKTRDWVQELQDRGAGEIVLNCMDQDGVRKGFDIGQLKALRPQCRIPLVASGGAGSVQDFVDVFRLAAADAALAAGVFHRNELTVGAVKDYCATQDVPVRPAYRSQS